MPPLLLACVAYLGVALPGSTLGLLWPAMRLSLHQPVAALGILLAFGTAASVTSSAATGRLLHSGRMGTLMSWAVALSAAALAIEALAPSLWVICAGTVLFGVGFGTIDAALNSYAASHFGARDINWMHASFGLGATIGPLLVTALLTSGLSWRWALGAMALAQAALVLVFALDSGVWQAEPHLVARPKRGNGEAHPASGPDARGVRRLTTASVPALAFAAVETGIESGAGVWGFVFLTAGRGLSHQAAGVAVAAYWATMFAGRAVLGPVAEHLGPARVLGGAVAGVTAGAALMTIPGPGLLAVIGMMVLGLAAAPVFPLFTLTTGQRAEGSGSGASGPARTVSRQVAASAIGGAAVPAGLGLAIGAFSARVLVPLLLVTGLVMCGCYHLAVRESEG